MSLRRRFINVARAEVSDWLKRLQDSGRSEPAFAEARSSEVPKSETREDPISADIARYYANLELPVGASADEVRAAYKRLMRRYHPDRHQSDAQKAKVATQLAQELRVAYESLLRHLGSPR